jgi:uncharacterized protein (DUF4415 family)
MPKQRPRLTDKEGEVRELTREDFTGMRPIAEADPGKLDAVAEWRNKGGRPKAVAPKVHIGFRLAADVVAGVKATGRGYNTRVEQTRSSGANSAGRGALLKPKPGDCCVFCSYGDVPCPPIQEARASCAAPCCGGHGDEGQARKLAAEIGR